MPIIPVLAIVLLGFIVAWIIADMICKRFRSSGQLDDVRKGDHK